MSPVSILISVAAVITLSRHDYPLAWFAHFPNLPMSESLAKSRDGAIACTPLLPINSTIAVNPFKQTIASSKRSITLLLVTLDEDALLDAA